MGVIQIMYLNDARNDKEIRLGVQAALQRHESSLGFFVPRSHLGSGRDPPGAQRDDRIQTVLAFDARGLFR
jgi:hypothetical protein